MYLTIIQTVLHFIKIIPPSILYKLSKFDYSLTLLLNKSKALHLLTK